MRQKLTNTLKKSQKLKGFTLIEMVIVIAIIAILILLVVPNLTKQKDRAESRTDEAFRSTLQTQVELADDKNISLEELNKEGFISDKQLKKANEKGITITNGKVTESKK
ncbi:competence type IV pilus major pilin ComGC [Lactobacillus rodentium]|uniref:Competence protein ComGC n=1 Tax=Lactobacillus rodentium TaxID=947835 RepID=A0A2Z6TCQ8_9LACO|nr:competence type IV pilus major pilin ComGC [Lactobacillus rodentium]MCR1894290.1 competence type IV pilus major pilin ComGC [Lactobacillus rodentium]GBG04585.1 competence protein ComGC [Lactobacillus rodentium]